MEAEERPAPPPGRDLPAPYEDPWMLLGRDLRAVAASARLGVWELARRNRQGDLVVPDFWPRDLSPWFWPLALGMAVAALVALTVLVPPLLPQSGTSPAAPAAPAPAAPAPPEQEVGSAGSVDAAPAGDSDLPPSPPPAAAEPVEPPPEPQTEPVPVVDPLLAQFEPSDPRGLIQAAQARPARSCLQLQLVPEFTVLAAEVQEQQAEAWRERTLALGYERLELVDGSGRLLGRTARVGSGMILLTSAAATADAPRSPAGSAALG